tara:strand:+ start:2644 stop:3042 length:399 start_codon:yes stop_codon:yes gene_type:complete
MSKRIKNLNPIQLELPFTKTSYKNNFNNDLSIEIILKNSLNQDDSHKHNWFNPYIPTANWDKRPNKKFIAELWVTKYKPEIFEIYAVSEKVAKSYLEKNFVLIEIYPIPDFPTFELNNEIFLTHNFIRKRRI